MMRREAEARKGVEEARLAVIRACGELRESEMFLSAVMADERSAVGSAASAAGVANTHRSNLREQVQPRKVLHTDSSPEEYAESQLIEAASALQKAVLVLGSPLIRHWFDERLLARTQGDLLQIQVAMLAKLQRLNARTINDLSPSQGDDHGRVAVGDIEDELVNVRAADSKSSSSVRCGGCTASCGLAGVTHLTGEGAIRGADGSPSSASSSAHSSGAEGSRGLPGASAHTPAGHTVQVSKYKFLRRREDSSARG
nr:MAG TPA: hypothetical protein [Caudoviricetes sp.]